MKQSKTPSNNLETPSDIDRLLLPRLQGMGYLFLSLSLFSLGFAVFAHREDTPLPAPFALKESSLLTDIEALVGMPLFQNMHPLELVAQDIFNFYLISLLFASIGVWLLYTCSKKSRQQVEKNDGV